MHAVSRLPPIELALVCGDPGTAEILRAMMDDEPVRLASFGGARELLGCDGLEGLDLVLYDCGDNPGAAVEFLREVRRRGAAHPRVVVLSGDRSVRSAVAAMKEGAADYLVKPLHPEDLVRLVQRAALERPSPGGAADDATSSPSGSALCSDPDRPNVVGLAPAWSDVLQRARRIAPLSSTVLLRGETGTGKEILARYIASYGPRASRPFIAVNCAALPENLVESELFGHARGAFTGATAAHRGVFEEAHTGTLLLDEVGALTMSAQGKLLRVLEERHVRHVGESRSNPVDVRVLAATNLDMEAAVSRHEFREDLYYRLNVVTLTLPPLRDRAEDIPLLARQFLSQVGPGAHPLRLSPEAAEFLRRYPFPGNVRELRHAVEQAQAFCDGDELRLSDFDFLRARADLVPRRDEPSIPEPAVAVTLEALREALQRTGGSRVEAARLLGIGRSTLYRLLRQLPPDDVPA